MLPNLSKTLFWAALGPYELRIVAVCHSSYKCFKCVSPTTHVIGDVFPHMLQS